MPQPDSLFFDLDGTLWDGVEAYAQGFNDFFAERGLARRLAKSDITTLMGLEECAFLAATLPEWPVEERAALYQQVVEHQYRRILTDGGELYPGVREGLIELARRFPLFIVSNCPAHTIERFLDWSQLRAYITDTMAHGSNHQPKHANLRTLIARHALHRPVYIGDTESDSKQAALAGVPFVFVEYGFGHMQNCALRAATFAQLVETLLALRLPE